MFARLGIRNYFFPVIRKAPRTRASYASLSRLVTEKAVKVPKIDIPRAVLFGVLGAGCYVGNVLAKENTLETLLAEADELYDAMKYEEIYVLLSAHLEVKHDEILWRLGRATYEKAKAAKTDDEKKVLYREALDYVEAALAINSENFAVHKWMSILIDYVYGYEGTKARISQSYNVKDHMEKACKLNPTDGTSRYLLGYWYYSIASIPWYQRKIASVVFATPPSGTYEDALKEFLHAEELEPNFYSKNLMMIGKCYQMLGKKEEAKHYLTRAMNYPAKTLDDKEAVDEATQLLKAL
ncbi:regulator of microtubule dynamics protein 1-like [Penaeus japonicus]|uniref:regulator of microtubule dynamics protein 1-like n=1 Tax=Penaeus japonicus TaxID=27405 RepID=UPI001C715C40|nr:regulator of microtubule dynamics protein 1-like [Penaeus japonicus]